MVLSGSMFPAGRDINFNVDWADVTFSIGYVNFDGFATKDSSAVAYHLVPSGVRTFLISQTTAQAAGPTLPLVNTKINGDFTSLTKALDLDFDAFSFQLPVTLKGTAFLKAHIGISGFTGSAGSAMYVIAKLRKWDGATETEVASAQSASHVVTGTDLSLPISLYMTVPLTHFKIGEQLRLTMEVWAVIVGDSAVSVLLAHDPNDGAESPLVAGSTRLVISVPFKVIT